ncbi:MAG: calcium-binding protein [Enhydrobacter sp.]|nr:calcium-binding protein [Enhydrobacter sp.]
MASIIGTNGNDTLNGTPDDDFIDGRGGADIMTGGDGDDIYLVDNVGDQVIEGAGQGSDQVRSSVNYTLAAGQEIETLRARSSAGLTLKGNALSNYLIGEAGNDTLEGDKGADRLDGLGGADTMAGGGGDDVYYVDNFDDEVIEAASKGRDTLFASVSFTLAAGQEIEILRVRGTAGIALTGNELNNTIEGGDGDDFLDTGTGDDRVNAGGGNDTIVTTGQRAVIKAGDGDDSIRIDGPGSSQGSVDGGAGTDVVFSTNLGQFAFKNVERLDTYYGFLSGTVAQLASFDYYTAGLAAPDMQISFSLRGAGGTLDFTTAIGGQNSVEIRDGGLTSAVSITGSANGDRLFGSAFDDTLNGGDGRDVLLGGDGSDTLSGGDGKDRLNGGAGNDQLTGGASADTFIFDSSFGAGDNIDFVADFASGSDLFELDRTNYFQGLSLGQLAASQFAIGSATGSGPQIVYDQATGALFYDGNGANAGGSTQFATVAGTPALTAADFRVI